jgi:hypothetical protein
VDEIAHPPQLTPEHLLVKEQQCCQGLVLCGRSDPGLGGERRQKHTDLELAHALGMALPVKYDEPPNPTDIGFFGARAVVKRPQRDSNTI